MRLRTCIVALAAVVLMAPALAGAQTTEPITDLHPAVPTDRGGVLASYNLADIEGMDPAQGFAVEADLRLGGTPLSFVGHVSRTDPSTYTGVGPRATFNVGPVQAFGHYYFGRFDSGMGAQSGVAHRKGGGVDIPFLERGFVRIGADHDGDQLHSVVGVGFHF